MAAWTYIRTYGSLVHSKQQLSKQLEESAAQLDVSFAAARDCLRSGFDIVVEITIRKGDVVLFAVAECRLQFMLLASMVYSIACYKMNIGYASVSSVYRFFFLFLLSINGLIPEKNSILLNSIVYQ